MADEIAIKAELDKLKELVYAEFADRAQFNIKGKIQQKNLIKTGNLLRSIDVKRAPAGLTGEEHTIWMMYYGEYLELGTPTISPRRFVREGLDKTVNEIEGRING